MIEARGLDGLALGMQLNASSAVTDIPIGTTYALGFHYPDESDQMILGSVTGGLINTKVFGGAYTVTEDFVTNFILV